MEILKSRQDAQMIRRSQMVRRNRLSGVPRVLAFVGFATLPVLTCHSTATDSISLARESLTGAAISDGRTVADLLSPETASVLLVYPPSECFSCSGLLPRWIELGLAWQVPVRLVLTRQPTQAEANKLKLLRVIPAGVLQSAPPDTSASSAHVFDGFVERASAVGIGSQSAMLDALTTPASAENKPNPVSPLHPSEVQPHD